MEGENTENRGHEHQVQHEHQVSHEPKHSNQSSDVITISKDSFWKYSTFVLLAVVVIGGFVFFTGDGGPPTGAAIGNPQPSAPSVPSPGPTGVGTVPASEDDDAVLGDPNAPVTIIEFSDYQCPFCGRFWSDTLPQIKSQYIDTGKAKLVFRDFPLTSIHPLAQPASEATECVREQGGDEAFFEYHDQIFANQAQLSNANLKKWASDMGYEIDDCLDSGKYSSEVQKDTQDAQAAGGRGTPYFVVNGKPLSGAQPFAAFQQAIESEL